MIVFFKIVERRGGIRIRVFLFGSKWNYIFYLFFIFSYILKDVKKYIMALINEVFVSYYIICFCKMSVVYIVILFVINVDYSFWFWCRLCNFFLVRELIFCRFFLISVLIIVYWFGYWIIFKVLGKFGYLEN